MSVKTIIAQFESELQAIGGKMDALKERAAFVESLLKELKSASKSAPGGGVAKPAKKRASKRRKGGTTVKDAILKAVSTSKEPMTPGEIIKEAQAISSGAIASIRTQINTLTKAGQLKQVAHKGRGFKYKLAK